MTEWRYEIQYGPEGEANYAWVYKGKDMIATMKTHHAVEIVKALSASPAGVVKPLETAPAGPDAMMPSSVDVHEGAWAWVIGTNGKKAGWVDTHALFANQLYRDSILSAIDPAGVGVETYKETQVSVVRDEDGEVLRRVMFRVPAALKGDEQ